MGMTFIDAITDLPIAEPSRIMGQRRRGRRAATSASRLLRHLAGTRAGDADDIWTDALRRVWFHGFCTGAASVAPDRVRRGAHCGEPFVAGDRRAIYCRARCRNTAVKRRYRARLRTRRGTPGAGA